MVDKDRQIVQALECTVRAVQDVLAEWLEPGILSSDEARDRLLELVDNPTVMEVQIEARAALAEHIEEVLG